MPPPCRLEVVGDRELAFFPGSAAGSIYRGFDYESEAGAVAAPLRFRQLGAAAGDTRCSAGSRAYSGGSGGGSSGGHHCDGADPTEWAECVDYVNGGPRFQLLDGSPLTPLLLGAERMQQAGRQRNGVQPPWLEEQQRLLQGIELLATYAEHEHAAAALLCHVGSSGGRAVLCGTHPELDPSWLAGRPPHANGSCSSSSDSAGSGEPAAAGTASAGRSRPGGFVDSVGNRAAAASALAAELTVDGHVQRLQAVLEAGSEPRHRFWRTLLSAAGLGPWMQPAGTDL